MEPIRPDDDELRAGTRSTTAAAKKPADKPVTADKPVADRESSARAGPERPKPAAGGGRSGGGHTGLLIILLLVLAAGGGWMWFQQEQRVAALEGQLEEADYWARQSKLALARFEGELTETGASLEQTGATIEQRLADQQKRQEAADGEIRKLWALANERNRKQLDDHETRLTQLAAGQEGQAGALAKLETSVTAGQQALEQNLAGLEQRLGDLSAESAEAAEQLTVLTTRFDEVDQVVERSLQRFRQEQKLAFDGLESRVTALERSSGSAADSSQLKKLEGQLANLRKTVESIDASRAQLTSRLVRLSEEVDQLRAR
ncbi:MULTISPECIES: hypothetical protein [Marinobacter]|uniref:Uncharacterized protein n=1 Tax=Marinobacter profundi TaxID=2666256 RepID=A0A2G1URP9_9GAMM|nr:MULTISPECIES: hypothetical protein [Marinobacter]MBD3656685.1 hypothetical protein [Marinobacter sp.]PHQ17090.1 hypothetical protein CLH61_00570 [Marinobacter profundi]